MISGVVRPAGPADDGFLREMLYEAVWPSMPRPIPQELDRRPDLVLTLPDWSRDGDTAVVIELDHEPVGAAWYRLFTQADRTWGYVDDETPELGIALVPAYRGHGFGSVVLDALIAEARGQHRPALSVGTNARKKPAAIRLLRRTGFVEHAADGDRVIMLLRLGDD
jgi:GNAT superfamily N-acetyltransferase